MAVKNTSQAPVYCGTCLFFPLPEALQAGGHGYCRRMQKARRYDWPATVLYTPHMEVRAREQQISVQQRKEVEDAKR